MSETQPTPFNRRTCDLFLAGAFLLLRIVLALDSPHRYTKQSLLWSSHYHRHAPKKTIA